VPHFSSLLSFILLRSQYLSQRHHHKHTSITHTRARTHTHTQCNRSHNFYSPRTENMPIWW
jgi:hypothetical protein